MTASLTSAVIKQWALDIGFDLVGIAPALPVDHSDYFQRWLQKGRHGSMAYLANNIDKRRDPRKLLPGANSIVCVAMNYYTPSPDFPPTGPLGRIARYAQGCDYHLTLKEHLRTLADKMKAHTTLDIKMRCFVDTAPIFEKAHAARAGLGWIGKNTLLINETFGSWLVLGEILTTIELDSDQPVSDRCGDCTQCLDACPTKALTAPQQIDARKCISYLTIESSEEIPTKVLDKTANRLFGCDTCQQACPYNQNPPITRHNKFLPKYQNLDLKQILAMTNEQFTSQFENSPIARPGLKRLQQHAGRLLKQESASDDKA